MIDKNAKFGIGAIVKHRLYPFRGVVVDVDPEFDNTDEWYESIPAELRPDKAQPFYHLLAENSDSYYTAYVSQQNLLPDGENGPIGHPDIDEMFDGLDGERYLVRPEAFNWSGSANKLPACRDCAVLKRFVDKLVCMRQNFFKNHEKNVITALNLTGNSAIYFKTVLN